MRGRRRRDRRCVRCVRRPICRRPIESAARPRLRELTARCAERIADRDVGILVRAVEIRIATDREHATRNAERDPDVEPLAAVVTLMGPLDGDLAAGDSRVHGREAFGPSDDQIIQCGRVIHVLERHHQGYRHDRDGCTLRAAMRRNRGPRAVAPRKRCVRAPRSRASRAIAERSATRTRCTFAVAHAQPERNLRAVRCVRSGTRFAGDEGMGSSKLPAPGDLIAERYVLRERIGEGAMGVVFRAERRDATWLALKLLHPHLRANRWALQRFADEATAAARIRHRGVVAMLDCDVKSPVPFIAMSFAPGISLGRAVPEEGLPVRRAVDLVGQILDIVGAVHAAGVVHADIKTDNFLIDGDDLTLIDFGLAVLDDSRSDTTTISGTPEYIAPELVRGLPTRSSVDLYGIAIVLYELLTGRPPFFGGTTDELLARQLHEPVIPPSLCQPLHGIPSQIDSLLLRALAKDPRDRFGDVHALQAALRELPALGTAPRRRRRVTTIAQPARLARGSEPRRTIATALVSGDVDAIAHGYCELASALVRQHRTLDAIRELEEGVDMLSFDDRAHAPEELLVTLAQLYERVGLCGKARRLFAIADRRVTEIEVTTPSRD